MNRTEQILRTLETGERAASQALSIADKVRGRLGRGAPRWHRWRALRLRIRAARLAGKGEHNEAHVLRVRAALHLRQALDAEGVAWRARPWADPPAQLSPEGVVVVALLNGHEPAEGEDA